MVRNVKIALLVCDTPVKKVVEDFGEYPNIFRTWIGASKPTDENVTFTMDAYDVRKEWSEEGQKEKKYGEYPRDDALKGEGRYDGIIITGSAASAYDEVKYPWIRTLVEYVEHIATKRRQVKIIGICFGHQIIARALGGKCEPNPEGWEVGVYDVKLTKEGKDVFGLEDSGILRIQQMHRDYVPDLPPKLIHLGKTDKSLVHAMLLPYPDSPLAPTDPSSIHILSIQGHPEFLPSIVNEIISVRGPNIIKPEVAKEGRERAVREHDGIDVVGKVVWKVLLAQREEPHDT